MGLVSRQGHIETSVILDTLLIETDIWLHKGFHKSQSRIPALCHSHVVRGCQSDPFPVSNCIVLGRKSSEGAA